jgi:RNA polymerase sigma-70 factor, ECF subfamily
VPNLSLVATFRPGSPHVRAGGAVGLGPSGQRSGRRAWDAAESPADLLLTLVGHGDSAAFAEFYDILAPAVFGVARRVLIDASMAEEVAQEVLTEVWRTAGRYDRSLGSAQAWVLTITHRRAVDRVRSEQAARLRDERAGRESIERDYDVVVAEVERRLEESVVRRCLEQLSAVQSEAIHLAYYGGHTQAEVADLLGAPLGTVKSRMRDGLTRLRECVGGSL